jgi:predicted N-acetyltransferase YhbS
MRTIRNEKYGDVVAREHLLDRVWGPSRFDKTAERLREDRLPAAKLSFVAAEDGRLIGTVRLWDVCAGPGRPALLLGPLAVEAAYRDRGIGSALMRRAIAAARQHGHRAVLLVGDEPFYTRFGFSADKTGALWLPGPYDRRRLLGCELLPGALDGVRGLIGATGRKDPRPRLTAHLAHNEARHAA